MKKTFLLILSLLAGAWMAFGQYVPTTSWPYVYDEFQDGSLIWNGGKEKGGKYNINLADKKLHFIEGAYIKASDLTDTNEIVITLG